MENATGSGTEKIIRLIERTVYYIGSAFLIVIMFLVTIDVGGRFLFNKPLLGTLELSEFLLAGAVFLGLGYTQMLGGHVNVELLFDRLSLQARTILKIFHSLIGTFIFFLIAWQGLLSAMDARKAHLTSEVLDIPAWPFRLSVPVGAGLIAVALFIELIHYCNQAIRRRNS